MSFKKIIYSILGVCSILLILIFIKIRVENTDNNFSTIYNIDSVKTTNFKNFKTVTLNASNAYESDGFKDLLQGENYRDAWQAKVKVPILFLDTLFGGVKIVKEGGGKQTKSLRLKTENGLLLTLRSVNKNPDVLVPKSLEKLGLENLVNDGISGQHPFAATVVAELAETLNILHTNPIPVFLPKQKLLGSTYSEKYGNKLYLLEYENKGSFNWTTYQNVETIVDSEDLQKLKVKLKDKLNIDKQKLIRNRLFDIIIGDWDRHAKQWGWVITKQGKTYKAIPLPADRDNAFFSVDGILTSIITNKDVTPRLQSFENDIDYLNGMLYDFDVYFLQQTTMKDFVTEAKYIQQHLTDKKIEAAFRVWNDELYNLDAKQLIKTIMQRRDNLINIAKKFKQILDEQRLLNSALKGSEGLKLPNNISKCFEC